MTAPRLVSFATVTAVALATAVTLGAPAPALAQHVSALRPGALASGGPPPPGGGYSHAVYSQVTIRGNTGPTGGVSGTYPGPPCWLEARFTGGQSWHPGDPQPSSSYDADSYWWWFGQQEPAFLPAIWHAPGGPHAINQAFKRMQGRSGWWWVPSWLSGSSGMACALGLVGSLGLNNGFLDFTPPGAPSHGDNPGTIDGKILADLARAALRLPKITVHTNPAASRPSEVNLPVWVWVTYGGKRNPSDSASVPLPDGSLLTATVTTSQPRVSLAVSTGSARVYSQCGATGSRYHGSPAALPPCGVVFFAPASHYTLTVTARWTVTWSDSTGASGGFASPPWPLPQQVGVSFLTVREIQAINKN